MWNMLCDTFVLWNCFGYNWWSELEVILCRTVETRMLLYDIAYDKAKLQLLNVKRDKLLVFNVTCSYLLFSNVCSWWYEIPCTQKKLQQLSSGLQKCDKIKLNFNIPSSSKSGTMDTQADYGHIHSKFCFQGKCQVLWCVYEVFI